MTRSTSLTLVTLAAFAPGAATAQVHYHDSGHPWKQTAQRGPDAEVPGWFYNLGVTGMQVRLDGDAPTELVVEHVFELTPAHGRVRVGDRILGAGGEAFETPHKNGYGMEVFGPAGPIEDFAHALEAGLASKDRRLSVTLRRDDQTKEVRLRLPRGAAAYEPTFPYDCDQVVRVRRRLLEILMDAQQPNGSWGSPVHDTFAPLALLSSGSPKHMAAVKRNARYHAKTTSAEDDSALINWRYMTAAIVLSEYALATKAKWVKPELDEIYQFLHGSQFTDASQINPKAKLSHPDAYPQNDTQQRGGWGHNVGFEGYGPIAMLTGQGALAFELMRRVGVEIDESRHLAAYEFLARGTGRNGYVWYADQAAGQETWADMGRTGASGIAHWLSPFADHQAVAMQHATLIGEEPLSFPDTHASPLMGMGYAALAAHAHRPSFERLMEANRWWFVLAESGDGTFHYQPNRDSNGYGNGSRLEATAVTAFLLSIHEKNLVITGK